MKATEFDVCIYHGNCADGIGAAFPFWMENKKKIEEENFFFIKGIYGKPPPFSSFKDKNVVIVDFSFSEENTIELCKNAKHVLILDHHITAIEKLAGLMCDIENLECIFDVKRSGAQIAWDYVYPSEKRPWFIEYIADRDLWKWELPDSKEINNALYTFGYNTWEKMEILLEMRDMPPLILEQGKIISQLRLIKIEKAVRYAPIRKFEGYDVCLLSGDAELRSEMGNVACLTRECDFAAFWRYNEEEGQFFISLRGSKTCSIELNKICEKYGGGGHRLACGFAIHTKYSEEWQRSDNKDGLAYGSIHDYFKKE